jgi:hypothetical protein
MTSDVHIDPSFEELLDEYSPFDARYTQTST